MRSAWPWHSMQTDWICWTILGLIWWILICIPVLWQLGQHSDTPFLPLQPSHLSQITFFCRATFLLHHYINSPKVTVSWRTTFLPPSLSLHPVSSSEKHIKDVRGGAQTTTCSTFFNCLFSSFVIWFPFLCIREHFISLRNPFKRLTFIWILIRVVLQGQFPVSLFQFFLGGIGFDPQDIIGSGFFSPFSPASWQADASVREWGGASRCAQLRQPQLLRLSLGPCLWTKHFKSA